MEALARLIGWKLSLHGVPVQGQVTLISGGGASNRYPSGTPVVFERISGHRDGNADDLPRATRSTPSSPTCAPAPPATRSPVSAITVQRRQPAAARTPVAVSGALRFADGSSPARRAARRRVHDRRARPGRRSRPPTAGPDGAWADERRAARQRPGARRVRAATARAARLESAPVTVQVVPSMTLTTRQAAREGRHGVRGLRHARARAAARRVPARAPGRHAAGCGSSASASTSAAAASRPRSGRRTPGLYRVSIIADGVTRRRTLRARADCQVSDATADHQEDGPLLSWLPRGRALPPEVWAARHRGLLFVLAAHLVVLPAFAVTQGWSLAAAWAFDLVPAAVRRRRAASPQLAAPSARRLCAIALLSCSAVLVVAWHGTIEAHFHYFVMVGALALYEEWWAYLLAIGFVVAPARR